MSSRKRSHPEDDSTPPTVPPVPPVLASREMFFSIPLRSVAVHDQPIRALPDPGADHVHANTRLSDPATMLNGQQRASLTALLAVLNDYFSASETTGFLTRSVGDPTGTNDTALATLADKIDLGLIAFLAKRGQATTPEAVDPSLPAPDGETSNSSRTAVEPKRARVSKKSGRSSRSQKIRAACKLRDGEKCRLCNGAVSQSAHILPFSMQGRRMLDFWAFVAIFRGVAATAQLKAAALDPDPTSTDNILNVIYLCLTCHALLDQPQISLIPQILEPTSGIVFPYDPRAVAQYDVVVEFPAGMHGAAVAILQADGEFKRMRPGHVVVLHTPAPATLPLPHPLLLELHAVCSRMVAMRAAAGYPVLTDDDSDADTVVDSISLADNDDGLCYGEFGAKDVARDPAVVVLELEQRRYEQVQLLRKLTGSVAGVVGCCI